MTEPGVPRYILFAADADRLRLAAEGEPPLVGVVQPGHGVRLSGVEPMIENSEGAVLTCDAAVQAGVIQLRHAGDAGLMRFLFQTWMRNHVWGKVVRALARRGQNLREWKLAVVDDALVLSRRNGGEVARHSQPDWWLIVDPDRAAEIAAGMIEPLQLRNAA